MVRCIDVSVSEMLRFHHIGVACRDLEKEIQAFSILGYRLEGPHFQDPLQKISGCFLAGPGPRVELLTPLDESSPVESWLRREAKMYHQAFKVRALAPVVAALSVRHAIVISRPKPAVAFGGSEVTFLLCPNGLLIELIENQEITNGA